jgi:hypothetical protein
MGLAALVNDSADELTKTVSGAPKSKLTHQSLRKHLCRLAAFSKVDALEEDGQLEGEGGKLLSALSTLSAACKDVSKHASKEARPRPARRNIRRRRHDAIMRACEPAWIRKPLMSVTHACRQSLAAGGWCAEEARAPSCSVCRATSGLHVSFASMQRPAVLNLPESYLHGAIDTAISRRAGFECSLPASRGAGATPPSGGAKGAKLEGADRCGGTQRTTRTCRTAHTYHATCNMHVSYKVRRR